MRWGELTFAVLLLAALMAQLVRVWKQREFESQEEEADREVSILQESKRIPGRGIGGPSEEPGLAQPSTEAFTARRLRTPRMEMDSRTMRRGIILMTILEPCRGVNPFEFRG